MVLSTSLTLARAQPGGSGRSALAWATRLGTAHAKPGPVQARPSCVRYAHTLGLVLALSQREREPAV